MSEKYIYELTINSNKNMRVEQLTIVSSHDDNVYAKRKNSNTIVQIPMHLIYDTFVNDLTRRGYPRVYVRDVPKINLRRKSSPSSEVIDSFTNGYAFLSNYYPVDIQYNGVTYKSAEALFQACKSRDPIVMWSFADLTAAQAKRKGRSIQLRDDWEDVKVDIMHTVCWTKFIQHPELATKLCATSPLHLIEGNTWGDTFWGVCNGEGKNMLGQILMQVRTELSLAYKSVKASDVGKDTILVQFNPNENK